VASVGLDLTLSRWAVALAGRLLPRLADPGPVVLNCDAAAMVDLAGSLGLAPARVGAALAKAVRKGGGLAAAAVSVADFAGAPRPRPVPQFLPALALLVFAADQMGEPDGIGPHAYYQRLARLLGPADHRGTPPYRGLGSCCAAGFPALGAWLAEDEAGARGTLLLPKTTTLRWIGWPLSQAPLRAIDRRRLVDFGTDRAAQLGAGWDPIGVLLNHPVRERLSKPAREMLDDARGRVVMARALAPLVGRGRAFGAVPRAPAARRLRGRLTALVDPQRGVVDLSLEAEGLGRSEAAVGPGGVLVVVPAPPATFAVPLAWCVQAVDGPVTLELESGSVLDVLPARLVLLVPGPLGLRQIRSPGDGPLWALTCIPAVRGEEIAAGLPPGWRLLADVDRASLPRQGGRRALSALKLVGGLPLGDRVWLTDAPPAVVGPVDLSCELMVDGKVVGQLREGAPFALDVLAGREGTFMVQAGALCRNVLLVGRGTRCGHGSLGWRLDAPARAAAGASRIAATVRPTLSGCLLEGDGHRLVGQAGGPWTRLQGTVHALRADGACELVRSPLPESWHASVGYSAGGRWRLPEGTVWACQPQRMVVQLVGDDEGADLDLSGDACAVVERCAEARVLGSPEAGERWIALVASLQTVRHG
jgi:hypothetical protein